ncbi:MAG: Asp-tRNA(Asn)/Glu-tRNA(Gln) amidotransferase subunit GatB [Desulfobacteraceae bacterium]|jgi:aspartyl-tRNA(Asn)/glutamyl-tRNA(Gln) amidotransferase subunit B
MDYDVIICFEVHAELGTRTKLFCGCPNRVDAPPNSCICPVCTGQPGALPVLNEKAVEYCVRAGLALHCDIRPDSCFARKNYFYPDLPKGYQISQYERPFCENGRLEITGDDGLPYAVGIKRIHLEEDAGKLIHSSDSLEEADHSLVDFNRACVPLIEIVADHTRNPLRSVREARTYLEKLRQVLRYIGVSDCSMEKGQFRCDVNVSLRPKGSQEFGDRAEVKNMASFRFVAEAITYEIERQAELLDAGKPVLQETRLFDEARKITLPMRSKEDAPDYRYFPDPDLVDVHLDRSYVEAVRETLPELPDDRVNRLVREHRIPLEDAAVLTRDREVSDFFDRCVPYCDDAARLGRWILKDLFKLLNAASLTMDACPVAPETFTRLVNLVSRKALTEQAARKVLEEVFRTGKDPEAVVEEKGLRSIQDEGVLEDIVAQVMEEHVEVVKKIQAGQQEPIHFLVGQVMKKTSGRANAGMVREILSRNLGLEA